MIPSKIKINFLDKRAIYGTLGIKGLTLYNAFAKIYQFSIPLELQLIHSKRRLYIYIIVDKN